MNKRDLKIFSIELIAPITKKAASLESFINSNSSFLIYLYQICGDLKLSEATHHCFKNNVKEVNSSKNF